MKNLGGTTLLLLLIIFSGTAMGAEVLTDAPEYPPLQTVIISGSGYGPNESVTLQVTQEDGTPLEGEYGEPWIAVADGSGNISSTWIAPYPDQPNDTVVLTGSGDSSGEEGMTTFLIAPQNYIHQLQNGVGAASPNWSTGAINANNSCYSEGRAVPYRYFVEALDGGTQHYITIETEWTKAGIHGFDYFTDYDFSESSGIAGAGGTCGTISASPPPDCQPISGSYPFPDPLNPANYSTAIPPDFFPSGFNVNASTNLSFYNLVIDSLSQYYFSGTASDRTLGITVYFTVVDTGSVGFFWGGHLAQGTPSTWGLGMGSGSISGAPIHMRSGVLDGSGGFKELAMQNSVICLPPQATITCAADSVCTDSTYTCSAPAGADDYIWSIMGGTILSGQGTSTITYTVTQPYPGTVYIELEACDTTSGCPGDNCCNYDSVELPVGYCCDPPMATCPGDTTIFACDLSQICLPGFDCNGSATVIGGTLNGNSVCFTPVEGLNTITLICANDCGDADTCVTNVTVVLNQAPACSVPNDTTIFQCTPTQVSLPVSATDPDNNLAGCTVVSGPGSVVVGYWQYTPTGDETVNVTVRCTDDCGAYCEASFSVTFEINEPPVCNLPPSNTYFVCDDSTFSFPVSATDADGNLVGCTQTSGAGTFDGSTWTFTATSEGVYSATFECADECGAICSGTVNITVDFNDPPVITCPPDIDVDCNGSTDPSSTGFATATDDHDPDPDITYSDSQVGNVITRTWTATDDCGVSSQCVQIITIVDTAPPTTTCPDDVSVQCPGDVPPPEIGSVTVTDDCDPNPVVTHISDVSDNQTCPETITRTYRATDSFGNYAECTQIITIDDTTPPVITCPGDLTFECDAVGSFGFATATDNCSDPTVVISNRDSIPGDCPQAYTLILTYTATDDCGNTADCQQTITVDDTTPPVIDCPPDITLDCSDPTDPSYTGSATATDNCDPSPDITYSDTPNGGGFHRTWTATDDCGNFSQCTQTITIDDTTPPTITCPDAVSVQCPGDVPPPDIGSVIVTDDCDPSPVVTHISDVSDNQTCPETITRTYRATDASGNYAECTQIITIDDTIEPVITCPADITVDCSDPTDPSFTGTATATDNCDQDLDITYSDSQTGDVITRTWTAVDDCDNSASCDQLITIEDTTPPTITCPDAASVQCPGDVPPADIGLVTVTDDCDPNPVVTFIGDVSDNNTCPETITRTYRATDASGNYAECTQIIIVDDTIPPEIVCPPDITVECNNPTDPSNTGTATATDNCDEDIDITYSDSQTGDVITRTWTAVDDCDNSASCDQIITVIPNNPPVCNVPNDTTIHQCNGNEVCLPVSATDPDGNLESCEITSGPGTLQNGEWCYTTAGAGDVTVTITCTDACGEFCEESFTVTFTMNNAPVLTVAADIDTFVCDAGDQICFDNSATDADLPQDELHFEMPSAPTGATIDSQTGEVCFAPGSSGTYDFTIRVYDICDEYDEGSVTIVVTENLPPTISANQHEFFFGYCPGVDPEEKCFNGFTYSDPDNSISELTVTKIQGPGIFNASTGTTCFTPEVLDSLYEFIYEVSDPCGAADYDTINVEVAVYDNCDSITCIDVALGDTACVFNSTYIYAPITIENYVPSIGGFELLITYDPSAFTFVGAVQGDAISEWEYFTYRTGPFGNCGDNCPSGMILLVGIADVNNGAAHPSPAAFDPNGILANLKFYVTDDRNYGGQSYPLRFFWMDCGNNMFSDEMGDTVYIDKRIYDPFGGIRWDEFDDVNFPESERPFGTGAPDYCVIGDKTVPIRCVQFFDGYISICHPDSIDLRGDLNMNELPNEVGDAVLYTNYFIYGPSVFIINLYGQVAASDINADGKTLTVGDLVYLIRIMTGDAVAIPKLAPFSDETRITLCKQDESYTVTTNSSSDMAAIRLSFAIEDPTGDIAVKLADNVGQFSIMSDIVGDRLNVLIYSFERVRIPAGENEIINIEAGEALELVSAEASDYYGNELNVMLGKVEVPTEFALSQNYPNPFNPETEIMLSLPESGNWSLDIYNIRGQLVRQFSGYSDAGTVHIMWDSRDDRGNEVASGIYFYKARVDDRFSQTRKMILLK